MDVATPQLLLRLHDLSDLRHLADLRRCLRAELGDLGPGAADDVVLLVSDLVARSMRGPGSCRHVRVLRSGDGLRLEVDEGEATRDATADATADASDGGPDAAAALLDALSARIERTGGPDGGTLRVEVPLPGPDPERIAPSTGTRAAMDHAGTAVPDAPRLRSRRGARARPPRTGGPLAERLRPERPGAPTSAVAAVEGPLAGRLEAALAAGPTELSALAAAEPVDDHDLLVTLGRLHGLHAAPLEVAGRAVRWQHHPAVAELTWRLEARVLGLIEPAVAGADDPWGALLDGATQVVEDPVAAMRAIATADLVPPVYRWLAEDADLGELVDFLALEGGPDAGFDDLVAACQVGLSGEAKLELARNYWDEMGRGDADGVHTVLHDRLVAALDMPRVPPAEQPVSGLLRNVLGSLLVRNRSLQPELVGALGLLELQAGPRCRQVVRAMRRLDAPADALPFYEEHAEVDPHHGKAWLDHAVRPLGQDPTWAGRMVRGARWRSQVNRWFFDDLSDRFAPTGLPAAG
jgi:hypothetical protein